MIEHLILILGFLALALITNWIAYLKTYFDLPFKAFIGPNPSLKMVIGSFLILICSYFLLAPLLSVWLIPYFQNPSFFLVSFQLIVFFVTAFLLFCYGMLNRHTLKRIWKDLYFPGCHALKYDLCIGLCSWFVAIPGVLAISLIFELLTEFFFGELIQDQLAVHHLKSALENPLALFGALFSILIAAPLIEEYLFRGVLQTYLRRKLGSWGAIALSALGFSLFHFSPIQSITNIVLLPSLFILALYLGFVYEKTRSLFASIVLHVTFNSASVIKIIFTEF